MTPLALLATGLTSALAWRFRLDRARPSETVVASVLVGLVLALSWRWRAPTPAVAGPLLVAMVADERRRRRRRAHLHTVRHGVLVAVDAMIQQLRAGFSLHTVCAGASGGDPRADEILSPMAAALARCRPLAEAAVELRAPVSGPTPPEVDMLATALELLALRGAPAVPALQRLRLGLVASAQSRDEAAVQASQALASAALLAVAPALFTVAVVLADDGAAHLYIREPLGSLCVASALVFSYAGWRWMDRSVARAAGLIDVTSEVGGR